MQPALAASLTTTVFVFAALYGPQPLLPTLQAQFGASKADVSLMITVTLVPLGIAPIFYGLLLQRFSTRRVLLAALAVLALSEIPLALADSLTVALAVRVVQGLAIPAALTALMTLVGSPRDPEDTRRALAYYVAATIFGGFFGRLLSGVVASAFGWRAAFAVVGIALALCAAWLWRVPADPPLRAATLRPGAVTEALAEAQTRRVYAMIFCAFFVFAALLNYLPFRMTDLQGAVAEWRVALLYSGYMVGIVIALQQPRIVALLGGARRAILTGLAVYGVAVAAFATPSVPMLFASMFLFCAGMFTVHAIAPGLVQTADPAGRGVRNGLYIGAYYLGGALGSYLPGFLYRSHGWDAVILLLLGMVAAASWFAWRLPRPSDGSA